MSGTIRGARTLTKNWQSELVITREGATAAVQYEAPVDDETQILRMLPQLGMTHPKYSGITLSTIRIAGEKGKFVAVCSYDGEVGGSPSGPAFDVQCSPSLREVPIETHPKFTEWAGTYKQPKEGIFDDGGRFIGWQPTSDFFGVTSFLAPSIEVTITRYESTEPDVTALGTIVSSAQGLPRVGGKRNWMLVAMPYKTSGDGFSISYTYMLSGKQGWNRRIYS